jgi:hypothetical protein
VTRGLDRIDFGLGQADQYTETYIVQNNARKSLVNKDGASVEEFLRSEIGKAVKSHRLFFLTTKITGDRGYASSRYEPVELEEIAEKLEIFCPFDAESLMADLSGRERLERFLSLSQPDLTYIRWALQNAVTGSLAKPEDRMSLTQMDRDNLRKYTSQNGLPVSRFLTAMTAQKLKAEGLNLEPKVEAKPPEEQKVEFALTNNVDEPIQVAFFDGDSRVQVDPGVTKLYRIEKGETRKYDVSCAVGQLICFGATVKSDPIGASWGLGRFGKHNCTNCCQRCSGPSMRHAFDSASSYIPRTITWNIENATSRVLAIAFYSPTRRWGWPTWDRNWTMPKGMNSHTLSCVKDEKICYGAWAAGKIDGTYWGAGAYAKNACKTCCGYCNGRTYTDRLID